MWESILIRGVGGAGDILLCLRLGTKIVEKIINELYSPEYIKEKQF